ncbi:hypothetical protein DL93DRAFT_2164973 [Clavulina sp. PMI_390]|nr:hypothetical protein DL93DRAFT_2164973 [Clavulina sp. PMI_390]
MSNIFVTASQTLLTPSVFALGLGLAGSSFHTFGNFANEVTGIGAIQASSDIRKVNGISVSRSVELWGIYFDKGKLWFIGAIALSLVGYGSAAVYLPGVREYLYAAIAASVGSGASVALLIPTNSRLLEIREKIHEVRATRALSAEAGNEGAELLNEAEQKEAAQLVATWARLHRVRFAINAIGWVAGFLAAVVI